MELYIGGYAQGKLSYVLLQKEGTTKQLWEPDLQPEKTMHTLEKTMHTSNHIVEDNNTPKIWNAFHLWVKRELEQGHNPEEELEQILKEHPTLCIISDEVGNGIVPMEAGEREYRERLGRMLCRLAQEATKVERITCGIGQQIK